MKDEFFMNSMCQNEYLHRFEIKGEYPEGVMEVCEICGMDKFFPILDGKVDNYDYMSWHLRQALPPFHPYYHHEHGEELIPSPYV